MISIEYKIIHRRLVEVVVLIIFCYYILLGGGALYRYVRQILKIVKYFLTFHSSAAADHKIIL